MALLGVWVAKTVCSNVKVFVDTSASRSHQFLTVLRASVQQSCHVSQSHQCQSLQPPKKPAGAFLKFMSQKSQEITSKNPDASQVERCKIAGHLWRNLDAEEKNKLKYGAREEMQIYREQYQNFLGQLNNQEKAQLLQDKLDRRITRAWHRHKMELQRLGRPKKPPNSFNLFVKASRLQLNQADPPNFLKGLVKSWKQMSEEEKAVYKVNAIVQKEKYDEEMAKWERKMIEMGHQDLIRRKSQDKLASSSKMTSVRGTPSKPRAGVQKTLTNTKDSV
ncbi:hypothetical protein ACOMHN_001377 [Nucella lapillus]